MAFEKMHKIFEKKVVGNGQQVLQVFTYSPLPQSPPTLRVILGSSRYSGNLL